MMITTPELFETIDSLVDTPEQTMEIVTDLRRKLNGEKPSIVITKFYKKHRDDEEMQRKLAELNSDVERLTREKQALQSDVCKLRQKLEPPQAQDGYYTMGQFIMLLTAKLGRSYGWRVDYIKASQSTPNARKVENDMIHKWQRDDRVPEWAVEQIETLVFTKREGKTSQHWTTGEEKFLIALYQRDPQQKNIDLARQCAAQFNRDITEASIKGAIDRLRKRNLLPNKRPRR